MAHTTGVDDTELSIDVYSLQSSTATPGWAHGVPPTCEMQPALGPTLVPATLGATTSTSVSPVAHSIVKA